MKKLLLVLFVFLPVHMAECADNRDVVRQAMHEGNELITAGRFEAAEIKLREGMAILQKQLDNWDTNSFANIEEAQKQLDIVMTQGLSAQVLLAYALYYQQKLPEAVKYALNVREVYKNGGCPTEGCRLSALEAAKLYNDMAIDAGSTEQIIKMASWAIEHIDTKNDSVDLQSDLHKQRSIAYAAENKFTQALADIDWIMQHSPQEKYWGAYALKCSVYSRKKAYKSTIKCADKLIDEFPENPTGYVLKGEAELALGDNKGNEFCKKALELDSNNEQARKCLATGKK